MRKKKEIMRTHTFNCSIPFFMHFIIDNIVTGFDMRRHDDFPGLGVGWRAVQEIQVQILALPISV